MELDRADGGVGIEVWELVPEEEARHVGFFFFYYYFRVGGERSAPREPYRMWAGFVYVTWRSSANQIQECFLVLNSFVFNSLTREKLNSRTIKHSR